jgi:hypothetical protein
MRGNIDWFLDNSQESLATQANHHWANAWGRLIGAADRFRRATGAGLGPLRANINEVVTFIDFQSAGMNKVNLFETKYQASPQLVTYTNHYAELERDDRGYLQRITVEGQVYDLQVDERGVVTNLTTSILAPRPDTCWTFRNQARQFAVLVNDSRLEGGPVQLAGVGQPAHGTTSTNADGTVVYTPALNYTGTDQFNYTVTSAAGGSATATVYIEVIAPGTPTGNLLVEYWQAIGNGSAVSDLTSHPNFPNSPTLKYYTNSVFELRSSYGDSYGSRVRTLLTPTVSGDYTFWIASDDGGELWFSPSPDATAKTMIAYVNGYATSRQWNKFASQQSAPVTLVAGQTCYLETLHKEGGGGDNLAVAWSGPAPFTGTNVIPATHLQQPFAVASAPQFTSDPLPKPAATPGQAYVGTLAGDVVDTNAMETLTFSKISGPAWLIVAANGGLSGTPTAGDAGLNIFQVRVTDSVGFLASATLHISVWNPAAPTLSAFLNNGACNLQLGGIPGQRYRVEYQAALPPVGAWQLLTDIVALAQSPLPLTDSASNALRFYRAVGLP